MKLLKKATRKNLKPVYFKISINMERPQQTRLDNCITGIWSDHFMGNRWGNSGNSVRLYFFLAPKSLQMVTAAMKLKDTYSLEEKL